LRQRLRFAGDIRAAGDIIPDQVGVLRRAGVSSVEVGDGFSLAAAVRSAQAYSVRYQRGVDTAPVAFEARAAGSAG
jgi:uncharacterized protein (DUF934 family)